MQRNLPIKGTRDGLLVKINPTLDFSLLLRELMRRFEESPSFFRGATLLLDCRGRTLTPDEDEALDALLAYYQVQRKEYSGDSSETEQNEPSSDPEQSTPVLQEGQRERLNGASSTIVRQNASEGALPTLDFAQERASTQQLVERNQIETKKTAEYPRREFQAQQVPRVQPAQQRQEEERSGKAVRGKDTLRTKPSLVPAGETADALLVHRTLRSGQVIQHTSHIIIVGDVNSGAEITAGGNVIVWGSLRGMVQAGYPDNDRAIVCALALAPLQLRIGTFVARPPEGGAPPHPQPEVAAVKDGFIVVEKWTRTNRR